MLLLCDCARDLHIDWFIFSLGKVVNILHVYWHFKVIFFIIFQKHEQMILFFCHVWIRTFVSLLAREMIQIQCTSANVDVRPMHKPKRASTSACMHWIWIISLLTRLTHLLTYKPTHWFIFGIRSKSAHHRVIHRRPEFELWPPLFHCHPWRTQHHATFTHSACSCHSYKCLASTFRWNRKK